MRNKLIAVALTTALLCMVARSSVACTTVVVEYHLAINSTEGGSVTTPGEGRYSYCPQQGETVNLVATPDPGYWFVKWTGDVGTIGDVNAAVTTITVNDDYSITGNFEGIRKHDLSISSAGGGSVADPGEGTFSYTEGTVVRLVAEADEGYPFLNWSGDVATIGDVNASTTTISMNDDYAIIANFEEIPQYELTVSSTCGGSVTTPGEGSYSYDEGEVVNLAAKADAGYYFVSWTGDVDTIADISAATTTITINGDYSIKAKFVRQD